MNDFEEFLSIKKANGLCFLDSGMTKPSYASWSGFFIPDSFSPSDIYAYTKMRIASGRDLQRLFSLSVAECLVDGQAKIDGVVNLDLAGACVQFSDFVDSARLMREKFSAKAELSFFLGIDSDKDNNLFLADTFLDHGFFSGVALSGGGSEGFGEAVRFSLKSSLPLKVSVSRSNSAEIERLLFDGGAPHLSLVNPTAKLLPPMKKSAARAVFTPGAEAKTIRKFLDGGVPVSLGTAHLLHTGATLSDFARALVASTLFSFGDVKSVLSLA